jgi:hypothetical protein
MEHSAKTSPEFERRIKIATAGATVVAAIALVVALFQLAYTAFLYKDQERNNRLERLYKFSEDAGKYLDEKERKQLIIEFPGRWEKDVRFCLSRKEADSFLEVALDPKKDPPKYDRWNLARKHLNAVETLAFPYYYNLVDPDILATSTCKSMEKSNKYFGQLIEVFGVYLGGGQSWQVIPKSVERMNRDYDSCKDFELKLGPEKVYHELPKRRETAEEWEEPCRN